MSTSVEDTRKVLATEIVRLYARIQELEEDSGRCAGIMRTLLQENEVLRDALGMAVVAELENKGAIVAHR